MIYLDNAATTYPKPDCVYEALDAANRDLAFNAGRGSYSQAKKVSELIDDTRKKIAAFVNLTGDTVSFESSATEALNIIINGLPLQEGDTVYISPFEHNAVVRPLFNLKRTRGINVKIIPFDKKSWEVDTNAMNDMFLMDKPKACFLSQISNVTGYILPVGTIFAETAKYHCINVLDSSQSFGILNPETINTDFIVFAGHKSLYASFGVAGFINVNNYKLSITKSGGTGSDSLNTDMPESGYGRYESGSLNSVAIAGLNTSIEWIKNADLFNEESELTSYLIKKLSEIDKVSLYLPEQKKNVLGIVSINIGEYISGDVGSILSEEFDICVRTGYHCCPFIHDFIRSEDYLGTVRISIGAFTTKNDIDKLCAALETF